MTDKITRNTAINELNISIPNENTPSISLKTCEIGTGFFQKLLGKAVSIKVGKDTVYIHKADLAKFAINNERLLPLLPLVLQKAIRELSELDDTHLPPKMATLKNQLRSPNLKEIKISLNNKGEYWSIQKNSDGNKFSIYEMPARLSLEFNQTIEDVIHFAERICKEHSNAKIEAILEKK